MKRPAKPVSKRLIAAAHAFYAPAFGKQAPEVPKARAPSRDIEHREQVALCQWWSRACGTFGLPEICLFAIPNGGSRHMLTAVRLKAEGVKAGVSDLFLAVPRSEYLGCFIEMKAPNGTMQENQVEFQMQMALQGYNVVTCYGADEAIAFIKSYLRG